MMRRRSVDFPQPLGPMRTVVRPDGKARSVGWSAVVPLNFLRDADQLNKWNHGRTRQRLELVAGGVDHGNPVVVTRPRLHATGYSVL